MRQVIIKVARTVVLITTLTLILLVEDAFLWFLPILVHEQGVKELPSLCSQVKSGMSRDQVLEIMHGGTTPIGESENQSVEGKLEHILRFGTKNHACTVELDPETGIVNKVKYEYYEFPPIS